MRLKLGHLWQCMHINSAASKGQVSARCGGCDGLLACGRPPAPLWRGGQVGWTRRNLLLVRALPHRPTPGCPPSGGGVRGGGLGETYYLSALFRNTPGPGCPPSGGGARAGWARRPAAPRSRTEECRVSKSLADEIRSNGTNSVDPTEKTIGKHVIGFAGPTPPYPLCKGGKKCLNRPRSLPRPSGVIAPSIRGSLPRPSKSLARASGPAQRACSRRLAH